MRRNNKKKGFTIVELVIVIAVIAILAAVMIPTFSGVVEKAQESAALQKASALYKEAYAVAISDGKIVATVKSTGTTPETYEGEKVDAGDLTFIFVPADDGSIAAENLTIEVYNNFTTGTDAPTAENGKIGNYNVRVANGVVEVEKAAG